MAKKSPDPIDCHVGARVRARRLQLAMSQEKLGDAIKLTFQQVQKYEKGANRIGASRLTQIARALQVPPTFFFEGLDGADGGGQPTLAGALLTEFFTQAGAAELAQHYGALRAADRHLLLGLAARLALDTAAAQRKAA